MNLLRRCRKMFLKLKVHCTCGCCYYISEKIAVSKITCPNCGVEYPYSEKAIKMLKIADEISDGGDPVLPNSSKIRTEVVMPEDDTYVPPSVSDFWKKHK